MLDQIIKQHKVIICSGSGGVGKTTLAATLGVMAAQQGKKVLVLTIDPARRLSTSLGLKPKANFEVLVPGQNYSGKIYAENIDPEKSFKDFIIKESSNYEQMQSLIGNPLFQKLSTTFSGSQEFTSLERLLRASNSKKFDLVILDTPPTGHAIDFLDAPKKLNKLFQGKVVRWFANSDIKKNSLWDKVIHRGTQAVMKSLKAMTGTEFVKSLSDFFRSIGGISDKIAQVTDEVDQLLHSKDVAFILVTGFDSSKLDEAEHFAAQLSQNNYNLEAIIINRCYPIWASQAQPEFSSQGLKGLYNNLERYFDQRQKLYDNLTHRIIGVNIIKVPEVQSDVHGLSELEAFSEVIRKKESL